MEKLNYAEIKEKLLEKRKELLEQSLEHSDLTNVVEGDVRDTADEASFLADQKVKSAIGSSELNEVKLIDLALERIEHGGYGVCADCNEPISGNRLQYYPYAVRCVGCQEIRDM